MGDLIKKIKIKKQDGTFTDYIPIGADAINISTSDGESVQLKLNKKPYYYNNVAEMKADKKLKVGDMAITLGYYEANDGGAAEYIITNVLDETKYQEQIGDLYAELILKDDTVNVKQLGAYGDGEHDDTYAIQNAINKTKNIFIPEGDFLIRGIKLKDFQTLYGVGTGSVLIAADDANYYFVDVSTDTVEGKTTIKNLYIKSKTYLTPVYGIVFEHGSTYTTSNLIIERFGKAGMWCKRQTDSNFNDVVIKLCQDGLVVTSTDCHYTNITCGQMQRNGIYVGKYKNYESENNSGGSGNSNYFINCKSFGTAYITDVYAAGVYACCEHCLFDNLIIQESYQDGLYLNGIGNLFNNIKLDSIGRIRDDDISKSCLTAKCININYNSAENPDIINSNYIYGSIATGSLPGFPKYGVYIADSVRTINNIINLTYSITRTYTFDPDNKVRNPLTGKIIENYVLPSYVDFFTEFDNFTNNIKINNINMQNMNTKNIIGLANNIGSDSLGQQPTYTNSIDDTGLININISDYERQIRQSVAYRFTIWNESINIKKPKVAIIRAKAKTSNQN